jgi:hypothetical protein
MWAMALSLACGGSSESQPAEAPAGAPEGRRVDSASAGRISGRVLFEGEAPEARPIDMRSDAKCRDEADGETRERVVQVVDGGLDNVFVYIKGPIGDYVFATPTEPVKLDQDGCMYTPRVLGVRVGQPLAVSNSDALLHNVHAAATINQQFNTAQPFEGMVHTHAFRQPEIMVRFKCDVHAWMTAYVGVVEHPYFAVTRGGGEFELSDVPPGTYTIEAWHETLGSRTVSLTLGERDAQELTLTYSGT